jgi:RNA-binding protein NOB1
MVETCEAARTWADRLGSAPEVAPATVQEQNEAEPVAVLDANAIISLGTSAASLAPVLASTEEVVAEIKDTSARSALSTLSISLRAPTEAAVRAVATFAARTGDLHQLSTEDVRLIALAYTYEAELYGTDHLRTEPVPVRAQGGKTAKQKLPGWGSTDAGWEAIDNIPDEGNISIHSCVF